MTVTFGGATLDGNRFPLAPHVTVALGGRYINASGFFTKADAKYTSSYFSDVTNTALNSVRDYWIANARLGYERDGLTVSGFVDNLFDETRTTFLDRVNNLGFVTTRRTAGVEVTMRF